MWLLESATAGFHCVILCKILFLSRTSPWQMRFRIDALKKFANFTGKRLCWSLLNKADACNIFKKRLQHSFLPLKLSKNFEAIFVPPGGCFCLSDILISSYSMKTTLGMFNDLDFCLFLFGYMYKKRKPYHWYWDDMKSTRKILDRNTF